MTISETQFNDLFSGATAQITVQDASSGILVSTSYPAGLLGQWHFDEPSGIKTLDASSSALTGTLVNNPARVSGQLGAALSFNGSNNYVSLPAMNFNYANGFTVEAWAYYNAFNNWSRIIDLANGAANDNILFANSGTTNGLSFGVYIAGTGVGGVTAAGALQTGTWLHLAAVEDGAGNVTLYKNGAAIATGTTGVPRNLLRSSNYIAKSNWSGDGYFNGRIDDVRLFNVARSSAQILADYQSDTLAAHNRGQPYSVIYSTTAGAAWNFISTANVTMTGSNGTTAAQTLQVSALNLAYSTNSFTCGGVAPCPATNQFMFSVIDTTGNVQNSGPYAILSGWGPFPQNPVVTAVYASSMTVSWGQVGSQGYIVDASTGPLPNSWSGNSSSATANGAAVGLSPQSLLANTTYYLQAGALWPGGTQYLSAGLSPVSSLALPVSGAQLYKVDASSITFNWLPLPASPQEQSAEGYILQASTRPDFQTIWSSSATSDITLSTLTVFSLMTDATYYFRVGSVNYNSAANYVVLGSTYLPPNYANWWWTGAAGTDWQTPGNWDPAGPPDVNGIVVVDTNSANQPFLTSAAAVYSLFIATSGVYGSTLTVNYPLTAISSVTVGTRGVITHTGNTSSEVYKTTITAINMRIDGKIDVSGKGYSAGYGPGKGGTDEKDGAGYGGQGGTVIETRTPGSPYGSYSAPVNLGSGGGATAGGQSGGGAVILSVSSTLIVNGLILANGASGGLYGGGSGGSIYINSGALTGGGTLSAQGGYASSYASGAGGRIAVIGSTSAFTGTIKAYAASDGAESGGGGTVFIKPPGANGTLIIDNNNIATNRHAQIPAGDYSSVFDQVRLNHRGDLWLAWPSTVTLNSFTGDGTTAYLRVDGNINFAGAYTLSGFGLMLSSMTSLSGLTDLTVGGASGAVITHEVNGSVEVHKASFSVTNLTIAVNGSIDVTGRGYSRGYGPGTMNSFTYGAGHGGQGGVYSEANTPGSPYGSYSAPVNIGSGGGQGGTSGAGGSGGGAVILNVSNTISVTGSIAADGGSGGMYGSGSGGSIYINTGELAGGGTLSAQGGYSSSYASGAGGRIAVAGSTAPFTGTIQAYAAADGSQSGGAGTVFIKTPGTNGTLIIDNNNIATNRYTGILADNNTLDSIQALHKSSATFLSFTTITITGDNAFLDGDNTSTVTVSGNVYGGSFTEVHSSSFSVKWGGAGNPSKANYTAEISTYSDYSVVERSSATYERSAFLTGVLAPNTTYYARVKTPDYATLKLLTTDYVVIGSTATLAAKPGVPADPFTGIYITSVTLSWLANGNPPYTEYQVQASSAFDFSGTLYGPSAGPSNWLVAASTTVVSLPNGETDCGLRMYDGTSVVSLACFTGGVFYFRVKARNMNSTETGFEVLGSTTAGSIPKLTIHKHGINYGISLVDPADPEASKLMIQTPEGIKAVRKYN